MRIIARLACGVGVVALVVAACGTSPTGSATPRTTASGTPVADLGLPADCDPIALRSPSGELVDLTGTWEQSLSDDQPPITWWVRQVGTCVWAVTMSHDFPESQVQGYDLQAFRGDVDSSFVIRGEIAEVAPMTQPEAAVFPESTVLELLVEFDEAGEAVLREDRVAGVGGPRCPDPAFHCLPPLLLTRAE